MTTNTPHEDERPAADWGELRPGEEVAASRNGVVMHRGSVEEILPGQGVLWIREVGTGARKLLSRGDDVVLHRC